MTETGSKLEEEHTHEGIQKATEETVQKKKIRRIMKIRERKKKSVICNLHFIVAEVMVRSHSSDFSLQWQVVQSSHSV